MIDITHKINSLRQAVASATVKLSKQETLDAIRNKKVPKGDVFEFSRAAGLLAVKKTSDVIPDCHPLPVEFASIKHDLDGMNILITVEVHSIYRTGVEVEAMHGAMITALTIYDMLKPIDKEIEISSVRLISKKGGKTEYKETDNPALRCAVVVCSDSISSGKKQDFTGKAIIKRLENLHLVAPFYEIIPDDFELVQAKVKSLCKEGYQLVLFAGGTGLSDRDITPEAVQPLIQREIPGIMEAARNYGQERTPYAMLSRGVAGFIGNTLVLTLPGSKKAAEETMDALFPYLLHVFQVAKGMNHDDNA
jgi:cyclic pyranopterin phosphate synthase